MVMMTKAIRIGMLVMVSVRVAMVTMMLWPTSLPVGGCVWM